MKAHAIYSMSIMIALLGAAVPASGYSEQLNILDLASGRYHPESLSDHQQKRALAEEYQRQQIEQMKLQNLLLKQQYEMEQLKLQNQRLKQQLDATGLRDSQQ